MTFTSHTHTHTHTHTLSLSLTLPPLVSTKVCSQHRCLLCQYPSSQVFLRVSTHHTFCTVNMSRAQAPQYPITKPPHHVICVSPCRKADGSLGPVQALAVGASARAFAACTFLPITVVKTRFEVSCTCVHLCHTPLHLSYLILSLSLSLSHLSHLSCLEAS